MKKELKNQKGITLVALVITIIVMLILVAVSVTVAINGGLFTKAKEAGNAWEAQSKEEADGNIVNVDGTITTIDGAIESLSGTSTTQTPATTITFTIDNTEYTTTAGTTWGQWIAANPGLGFAYYEDGDVNYTDPQYGGSTFPVTWRNYGEDLEASYVNVNETIQNGGEYLVNQM